MPVRVLVVDDDRLTRLGIRRVLEEEGHVVLEAADGETALYKLATERPQLVLLDLHLGGGIDGFEVARRAPPDVKVVIVTGDSPHEVRQQATEHMQAQIGKLVIVTKPWEPDELLAVVDAAGR